MSGRTGRAPEGAAAVTSATEFIRADDTCETPPHQASRQASQRWLTSARGHDAPSAEFNVRSITFCSRRIIRPLDNAESAFASRHDTKRMRHELEFNRLGFA